MYHPSSFLLSLTPKVTPNGYGDAISGDLFVKPDERTMNFEDFVHELQNPASALGVYYISHQVDI